ncbi:hypothetical protein SEA_GILGAMESH_136 [Streptomyces phage Gilgamesh]|uniref:Uncharacterized protein n=1 Tax=Streptomyces phage Gilgamesh TaxID=2599890 RepID=A0A5J6TSH3_9CAUD|nr:hypothetical protein QEH35_gp136 [Streptomyces phage Gilgamesh]QFG13328.1 hypothetical protein SEA_GILGAMESH_136 [Streptomyces phage Gilgamesh]
MQYAATPEQLAALDGMLRPSSHCSLAVALDAAEVHADTVAGRHTTEGLGRYCRTALPMLLRRLLAVESELLTIRGRVAGHVAAADQGADPTPGELLEELKRAGVDLRADVEEAALVLEAEARVATFG